MRESASPPGVRHTSWRKREHQHLNNLTTLQLFPLVIVWVKNDLVR